MRGFKFLSICLLSALAFSINALHSVPVFPSTHHVKGIVELPYAELTEPFEFWRTEKGKGSSRLDWYDGLDTVIDRPDLGSFGKQFSIAYTTLGGDVNQDCFEADGSGLEPIEIDTVIPDLSNFTFAGEVDLNGEQVYMLFKNEVQGQRDNMYKFYYKLDDQKQYVPVLYTMLGYDTLLGSHYDKYSVTYSTFDTNVPDGIFDYMSQFECGDFPGPGATGKNEHGIMMNPMKDLVQTSRFDDAHGEFAKSFDKNYKHEVERRKAGNNYMQNLRYINSKNRQGLSYKLKVNHMADMTRAERRRMLGLVRNNDGRVPQGAKTGPVSSGMSSNLPSYWDWRVYGAVTQVKDQAICGSCWSFGTTGTLEGAYFLKYGNLVRLSQQNLMDCSWNQGNNGCDGGEDWRSYEYIQSAVGGVMSEDDYGSYLGQDGKCHFDPQKNLINIKNYTFVEGENVDTVKYYLVNKGPLSIGIDASHASLSFYSHGIYDDPACKNGLEDLDHAVLLVGYGDLNGRPYWLVKNSWSTYWGNLGYVTFAQENNVCGVMTQPSFVDLA